MKNPADGWDGDYDISTAEYRDLVEIPGFRLRKSFEIGMLEEKKQGLKIGYKAIHRLPSEIDKNRLDIGILIYGKGKTEDGAAKNLANKLAERFTNPQSEYERQYLTSIMVPKKSLEK
jgi:hypothetical protein